MNKLLTYSLFLIALLFFILTFIRSVNNVHLDDVSPAIPCDKNLIESADVLYVIPEFNNVSISDNLDWCSYILSFNKTIAMHGVYHTYKEFETTRSEKYIQDGADDFKKCFVFAPTRFKAPQVSINSANLNMISNMGYVVDTWLSERFHKVYHCNDEGEFPNWVSDLI